MEFTIYSLQDIDNVARDFLNAMKRKRIFAFQGKMGAGKTTFIKSLCRVLQVENEVTSPTFAICNVYLSKKAGEIYHFDFYRLNSPEQALDIGCEEYFASGSYCFMEWADNIGELLPAETTVVNIEEQNDGSRKIIVE